MRNNKVDHPRKSSKDLADAVCGAIFGAISHTQRLQNQEIEIHTFKERPKNIEDLNKNNVISPKPMTKEVEDYLGSFNLI